MIILIIVKWDIFITLVYIFNSYSLANHINLLFLFPWWRLKLSIISTWYIIPEMGSLKRHENEQSTMCCVDFCLPFDPNAIYMYAWGMNLFIRCQMPRDFFILSNANNSLLLLLIKIFKIWIHWEPTLNVLKAVITHLVDNKGLQH